MSRDGSLASRRAIGKLGPEAVLVACDTGAAPTGQLASNGQGGLHVPLPEVD